MGGPRNGPLSRYLPRRFSGLRCEGNLAEVKGAKMRGELVEAAAVEAEWSGHPANGSGRNAPTHCLTNLEISPRTGTRNLCVRNFIQSYDPSNICTAAD